MSEASEKPPGSDEEGSPPEADRRSSQDRREGDRRADDQPVAEDRRAGKDRRTGPRRTKRSMNEYEMGSEVLEFINAINDFKARSGRAFPTWTEVLGILKDLGYEKRS